jgi:hypothetical protein
MVLHWQPPEQLVTAVPAMILAAVSFVVGAIFVFWGWKIYRVALVVMGALVGCAIGAAIAAPLGIAALLVAIPLALFCAMLAVFVQRLAVFLIAGLWAALLVLGARELIHAEAARFLAAAGAFFVVGGVAVLLWRPVITFLLGMFGAWLVANAVAMTADTLRAGAWERWETAHPWITFAAIVVAAAVGLYHQEEEEHAEKAA